MNADPPVTLVTGASRGLGYALGLALGRRGHRIVALARTVGGLEDLDDAIRAAGGCQATLVPLDITDAGGLARLALSIHERWGRLDLLVHCAAHAPNLAPAEHIEPEEFERSLAVNAAATQVLIAVTFRLLKAAPAGRAVFCDDPAAGKFHGAYAASKAAMRALVEAYAAEHERLPPQVRLITPPPMPTALRARFHPGQNPAELTSPADAAEMLLPQILD